MYLNLEILRLKSILKLTLIKNVDIESILLLTQQLYIRQTYFFTYLRRLSTNNFKFSKKCLGILICYSNKNRQFLQYLQLINISIVSVDEKDFIGKIKILTVYSEFKNENIVKQKYNILHQEPFPSPPSLIHSQHLPRVL